MKQPIAAMENLLRENIRDIILLVEVDGRILAANQSAVEAYGYEYQELVNSHIFKLRGEATVLLAKNQIELAMAHGILFETIHRRKDGSLFPVRVNSQGITLGDTTVLLSIIRSMEDEQEPLVSRNLAYAELDQIFNTATECICITAKDLTVLRINQSLLDMLKLRKEDAIGRKCSELFHNGKCHTAQCPTNMILQGKKCPEFDVELKTMTGESCHCITAVKPFFGQTGEIAGVVHTFKDITERKKAERALRKELAAAQAIQQGFWGHDLDTDRLQITIFGEPASVVSGDLCDYTWVSEHRVFGFVLDVMGHGLSTALQTSGLKVLFRGVAEENLSLVERLRRVNAEAIPYFTDESYAAAIVFEIDFQAQTMTYAGAGITRFYCQTDSLVGEVKTPGSLIGLTENVEYQGGSIPIKSGDCFYFLSDGLQEMLADSGEPPWGQYTQATEFLRNLAGSKDKKDDASALCIHIR